MHIQKLRNSSKWLVTYDHDIFISVLTRPSNYSLVIAFWAAENIIVETGNFVSWYALYANFQDWQENKFTKQIANIPFLTFTRLLPDSMNLLKIQI